MRDTTPEGRRPQVADRCDVCMEERMSVLEGDRYVCEVCLDGAPTGRRDAEATVKI